MGHSMQVKNAATPIIFAMVFAFQAQALAQDPKIGSAEQAQNKVEGIIGGQSQPVSKGTALYSNETVRTGENGVADLVFLDSTNLTVGPISEVLLDKFVYDPNGSSGVVVLQATKGAFRFVTGSQDKRAYQVQTPFGSLGVRGTIVEMMLVPCVPGAPPTTCGATLRLVYGAATFTTATETIALTTGTTLSVNGSGQSSLSSGSGSILPGVMAALGAADVTGSLGSSGAGGGGGGTGGTGTGNTQTSIGGSLGLNLLSITNRPAGTTPPAILPPITITTAGTAATATTISNCTTRRCADADPGLRNEPNFLDDGLFQTMSPPAAGGLFCSRRLRPKCRRVIRSSFNIRQSPVHVARLFRARSRRRAVSFCHLDGVLEAGTADMAAR